MKVFLTLIIILMHSSFAYAQYLPVDNTFSYLLLIHTFFYWGLPAVGTLTVLRFFVNFIVVLRKRGDGGDDFERAKRRMRFSLVMACIIFLLWGGLVLFGKLGTFPVAL